ncbi:MAG: head-tail adaptor protein [Vicinamibacterales bacterium]
MKTLNRGTLIHRVLIQQRDAETVDDSGAPNETDGWTALCYAWMSRDRRRADRGGESIHGDQVSALMTTRWTMPYLSQMDPDDVDVPKTRRLVVGSRVQDIVDAEVLDRRIGIELRTVAHSKVTA